MGLCGSKPPTTSEESAATEPIESGPTEGTGNVTSDVPESFDVHSDLHATGTIVDHEALFAPEPVVLEEEPEDESPAPAAPVPEPRRVSIAIGGARALSALMTGIRRAHTPEKAKEVQRSPARAGGSPDVEEVTMRSRAAAALAQVDGSHVVEHPHDHKSSGVYHGVAAGLSIPAMLSSIELTMSTRGLGDGLIEEEEGCIFCEPLILARRILASQPTPEPVGKYNKQLLREQSIMRALCVSSTVSPSAILGRQALRACNLIPLNILRIAERNELSRELATGTDELAAILLELSENFESLKGRNPSVVADIIHIALRKEGVLFTVDSAHFFLAHLIQCLEPSARPSERLHHVSTAERGGMVPPSITHTEVEGEEGKSDGGSSAGDGGGGEGSGEEGDEGRGEEKVEGGGGEGEGGGGGEKKEVKPSPSLIALGKTPSSRIWRTHTESEDLQQLSPEAHLLIAHVIGMRLLDWWNLGRAVQVFSRTEAGPLLKIFMRLATDYSTESETNGRRLEPFEPVIRGETKERECGVRNLMRIFAALGRRAAIVTLRRQDVRRFRIDALASVLVSAAIVERFHNPAHGALAPPPSRKGHSLAMSMLGPAHGWEREVLAATIADVSGHGEGGTREAPKSSPPKPTTPSAPPPWVMQLGTSPHSHTHYRRHNTVSLSTMAREEKQRERILRTAELRRIAEANARTAQRELALVKVEEHEEERRGADFRRFPWRKQSPPKSTSPHRRNRATSSHLRVSPTSLSKRGTSSSVASTSRSHDMTFSAISPLALARDHAGTVHLGASPAAPPARADEGSEEAVWAVDAPSPYSNSSTPSKRSHTRIPPSPLSGRHAAKDDEEGMLTVHDAIAASARLAALDRARAVAAKHKALPKMVTPSSSPPRAAPRDPPHQFFLPTPTSLPQTAPSTPQLVENPAAIAFRSSFTPRSSP